MKKSTFTAMILGTIGGIFFALGMCMALIPEWNAFQPGVIMGAIGCPIDWNKTAQQVHDHVRGLHPWPVATAELAGTKFKIHATKVVEGKAGAAPGTVLALTKTGLQVACGEGAVEILQLQAEGGKRMAAPDYFRGHPLEV